MPRSNTKRIRQRPCNAEPRPSTSLAQKTGKAATTEHAQAAGGSGSNDATPPRLNDNPGSNKHRPRRPPTDAETTPSPSHSPCDERQVLQPTRCAIHAPAPATHHPPPVSGNQGSRLSPRPSPPRTAAHLRTPATPTNDDTTYANSDVTHA